MCCFQDVNSDCLFGLLGILLQGFQWGRPVAFVSLCSSKMRCFYCERRILTLKGRNACQTRIIINEVEDLKALAMTADVWDNSNKVRVSHCWW